MALGLLENGRARHGESLRYVDHMRAIDTVVEVTDPVVFDPSGDRMRG